MIPSETDIQKGGIEMDNTNIEYLLNIFRELTTELPHELIYRENGDSIELKSIGSYGDYQSHEVPERGWSFISDPLPEVA